MNLKNIQFKNLLSFKDFESLIKSTNAYKKVSVMHSFLSDYIYETTDDFFITIVLKLFSDSMDNLSDVESELISLKYLEKFNDMQSIETITKYLPVIRTIFKPVQNITTKIEPTKVEPEQVVCESTQPAIAVAEEEVIVSEEDLLTQRKSVEKPKKRAVKSKVNHDNDFKKTFSAEKEEYEKVKYDDEEIKVIFN